MRVTMRMPIKKQYNLVTNDELDTRVPLHPEEAFTHGIKFLAKYIGTLDVPRPTSRVEIVAAMRRIRYEFKAKGIKKKKVSLEISVDGVKILKRKKKKHRMTSPDSLLLMTHPIYRIFYVSHDSQDLKIFSYIARDAASNVFRCHVFKANKKNQAMRVVRTVGQAFEVVHKMSIKEKSPSPERLNDDHSSIEGSQDSSEKINRDGLDSESGPDDLMTLKSDTYNEETPKRITPSRPTHLDPLAPPIGSENIKRAIGETFMSPLSEPLDTGEFLPQAGTPLSVHHELQLLREQLGQQQQQTQAAVAQVHLLRDQLAAETAARLEAQARTHQLLVHNKELLEHIQQLVLQVRDLELKFQGSGTAESSVASAIQMVPNAPDLKQELRASQQQLRQREMALKLHQIQHPALSGEDKKIDASIEVDAFHDSSGNSSKESVSSAIAQLFASETNTMWLPRVPEERVTSGPLWNAVNFGGQRCPPQPRGLQPSGPITRAASERYSRQETLAQLQRMAWARHTTK